jgi:hypothetical protein
MPKRKVDVLASGGPSEPEPLASYLRRLRNWKEGGMEGPKPIRGKRKVSK